MENFLQDRKVQRFAVPAVACLICFLAYTPQLFLFHTSLEPGALSENENWWFNGLLACLWVSYARAVLTDPGKIPQGWVSRKDEGNKDKGHSAEDGGRGQGSLLDPSHQSKNHGDGGGNGGGGGEIRRTRFCRKCQIPKPPRAHHCKICARCVPKMDHHCPWTANCVSHTTFPHFMRFLLYAVTSMVYLSRLLWPRAAAIWQNRNLPSYLGPSAGQMFLLFTLLFVNSIVLFAVGIMFLRTIYDTASGTTTIETWEIERHEQLLQRAKKRGGYLDGPNGTRIKITRQEFPYDLGIWQNTKQAMGGSNPLFWLLPFAGGGKGHGIDFETNGLEDPGAIWPPPDPDRIPRTTRSLPEGGGEAGTETGFVFGEYSADGEINAFRRRQQADFEKRYGRRTDHRATAADAALPITRRRGYMQHGHYPHRHHRNDQTSESIYQDHEDNFRPSPAVSGTSLEQDWEDSDGSKLKDFGVDEEAEFFDEGHINEDDDADDHIPLAELIHRRREQQQ